MAASSPPRALSRSIAFELSLFAAALVVALAYNVLVVGVGADPAGDAFEYDLLGRALADGRGFIGTKRTPVFPALVGAVYTLAGVNPFAVRIVLCILTAGLCVLIYRLGRLTVGENAARAGAVMAAGYPPLLFWSARLNTEIPFTTLLTAFMLCLARVGDNTEPPRTEGRRLIVAGLLLGLTCLTRPAGVFVFPLVPFWAALVSPREPWITPRIRAAIRRTLLVILPALLVIAPWTVRNYRVTGHRVFLSTLDGNVLLGSNNPRVAHAPRSARDASGWIRGGWVSPEESELLDPGEMARVDSLSEYDRNQLYRARALAWMRAHPGELPSLVVQKIRRLFELVPPERGARELVSLVPYYAIFAGAVLGAWITRRSWRRLLPLYLAVLATVASAAVTWGGRRFRHPIEPVLLLLAGVTAAQLFERVYRRRTR